MKLIVTERLKKATIYIFPVLISKHTIMKNIYSICFIFLLSSFTAYSQQCTSCHNTDFEQNNFDCWTGEYGITDVQSTWDWGCFCFRYTKTLTSVTSGFIAPRHTLVQNGTDPLVPALSMNNPFEGTTSLRLGDELVSGQGFGWSESVEHSITVTPATEFFTYIYAVVLQDGGHSQDEQPYFNIKMWDGYNNEISCATYEVSASGSIPGFQNGPNAIKWKDWARVIVQLTPYMGQTIRVQFSVGDCTQGGHFGYAYLDANCERPTLIKSVECAGSQLEAPAGAQSYIWTCLDDGISIGTTTSNTQIIPYTGNWEVELVMENGCNIKLSDYVFASGLELALNPTTSTDIDCFGELEGSITVNPINGAPPYQYSIDGGLNYVSTNVFNNLPGGTHHVYVKDAAGCIVNEDVILAEPLAPLIGNLVNNNVTCNGICNGNSTVTAAGGTSANGNYTYLWSNGLTTQLNNNLCAGTYSVTITDDNQCTHIENIVITQPTPLTLTVSNDITICPNTITTLTATASGGSPAYQYYWDNILSASTHDVSPVINTNYIAYAIDANGCRTPNSNVQVSIFDPLTVTTSADDYICPGDYTLVGALASGGNGTYSYAWDNIVGNNPQNVVSPILNTTYTVTATDGCNQTAIGSININIFPMPNFDLTPNKYNGCVKLDIEFENKIPLSSLSSAKISFGDGSSFTGISDTYQHTYKYPGLYSVHYSIVTSDGCLKDIHYLDLIEAYPIPTAGFTPRPSSTDMFDPTFLFIDESQEAILYQWKYSDGGTDHIASPEHTFATHGLYTIQQIVENNYGCLDSMTKEVEVKPIFSFFVPNSFTPSSSEGVNDVFKPVYYGVDESTIIFTIYTRWGDIIYEANNFNGWDGKMQGVLVQMGVYTYRAEFKDIVNHELHQYIGPVNLLR